MNQLDHHVFDGQFLEQIQIKEFENHKQHVHQLINCNNNFLANYLKKHSHFSKTDISPSKKVKRAIKIVKSLFCSIIFI